MKKIIQAALIAVTIIITVIISGVAASCSSPVNTTKIDPNVPTSLTINYSAIGSSGIHSSVSEDGMNETVVVRCTSVTDNINSITIQVVKSKTVTVNTLLFIDMNDTDGKTYVQAAMVPITGKENEYDLASVRYYKLIWSSAQTAINSFGVSYGVWLDAVTNNLDSFSCCG